MIIRSLDGNHDWQFGKGLSSYLSGNLAIMENIQTRLLSFLNDCFFDMNAGIDWITFLGTPGTQEQLNLRVRAVILLSTGVVSASSVFVNVDRGRRQATITYNINTVFSTNVQQNVEIVNYV